MEKPNEIKVCNLQVVCMPNGEIICAGTTVGWFDKIGEYLTPEEAPTVE